MRVLHYYTEDDPMVCLHVSTLCDNMRGKIDCHLATDGNAARTLLQGSHYDLLHLHGCWCNSARSIVNLALRQGTRLLLTPHGQLEPWVMEENKWREKMPKRLFYQRDIVRKAYAVVIQGKMEQECMQQLAWNRRTVIIRNSVITSLTSPSDMAAQTLALYQKVVDSNPLHRMQADTQTALRTIIKAGITGDKRWLTDDDSLPAVTQWREILCYAHQEEIIDSIRRGIRVLGLEVPDINVERIDYFVPDTMQPAAAIGTAIGNQFVSENERLLATFRYLRRIIDNGQIGIKHLIELDRELREHDCQEEELRDTLEEKNLLKIAARLMQVMMELTGLTEGFMPVKPLDDRLSRRLRKQIDNHLTI